MVERWRPPTGPDSRKANKVGVATSEARAGTNRGSKEKTKNVGYGSPPVHTRFKSGRSGNPHGRPKNSRNLKSIIQAALSERILVREGEKRRSITKLEGVVLRQVESALKGNHRSALATLKIAAQVGLLENSEDATESLALTQSEQQIVQELLSRHLKDLNPKRSRKR